MEARLTPRQIAKKLLNGEAPPRALVLPIVFSLGAKVENVPMSTFLANPTKIVNAARKIGNHLQADGVACYFDPYLEVEALGARLEHRADDRLPVVRWKTASQPGTLPGGLRSPEEAVKSGKIPLVAEVIRRMNAVASRDFLLMASVSGPLVLAALLTPTMENEDFHSRPFSKEVLEFAASAVTQTVSTFLDAGADLIFIHEKIPESFSIQSCTDWVNLVSPTVNVTRFYEALPVLQIADSNFLRGHGEMILRQPLDCVVCPPSSMTPLRSWQETTEAPQNSLGIALSMEVLRVGTANHGATISPLRDAIKQLRLAVITTAGDVPSTADIKHLKNVFDEIVRRS